MELLLRVEQRVAITGRGIVIEPGLPVERASPRPFTARLRLPDGTERDVEAVIERTHAHGPNLPPERRWWGALVLRGITKDEVPEGTEVFVVDMDGTEG